MFPELTAMALLSSSGLPADDVDVEVGAAAAVSDVADLTAGVGEVTAGRLHP